MERDAFGVGAGGSGPAARSDDNLRHADPEPTADSELDSTLIEQMAGNRPRLSRWMGWRRRLLVGAALAGCVGLLLLAQHLADSPHVDAAWRADAQGRIELVASADAALSGLQGQALVALGGGAVTSRPDALALQRSARWLIDDDQRARHRAMHEQLSQALLHEHVKLTFANGSVIEVPTQRRGYASLPSLFWVLAVLALVLYLVAMVVVLAKPSARNLVYAIMSLCQVGNLVLIATESGLELALPAPFPRLDMSLRMAFDLVTAAAIVHAACLHPRRLPGSGWMGLAAWVVAFTLVALGEARGLPQMWWWTQSSVALLGLSAIGLLSWSYQIEAHPFAIVLRRFGVVTLGTWVLLTLALAAAGTLPSVQHDISATGSLIWYVFLASLLLLIPFLSKSQQIMREFSLLAAISTVATSLDLLFVATFSLGQFASLTLSLFVSLGVYAGVRQWILSQLLGSSMLTTERTFEQLYRIAREVEAFPERTPALLAQLLRDPNRQQQQGAELLLRTGTVPMKSIFVIMLGAVALQCAAQTSERAPVTDVRPLMLAALRSPDGQAHGLLTGDIADAISKRFSATTPIFIDVTSEKRYTQAGCSRLKLSFWQDGVLLPGAKAPRKQTIEFGINYCLDGMPPKSLS